MKLPFFSDKKALTYNNNPVMEVINVKFQRRKMSKTSIINKIWGSVALL